MIKCILMSNSITAGTLIIYIVNVFAMSELWKKSMWKELNLLQLTYCPSFINQPLNGCSHVQLSKTRCNQIFWICKKHKNSFE